MNPDSRKLLTKVRKHYEASHDFNGLPLSSVDTADTGLREVVIDLIRNGHMDLVRGDRHPNPHIKALPAERIDVQISKIEEQGLGSGCLYPTAKHLQDSPSRVSQVDAPFTHELELGAAQLEFRAFDLRVLEFYRNDPRYDYKIDDIHGQIRRREDASAGQIAQDRLTFFKFGFAYNDKLERAVASFLRYLRDLPPEQQQFFKTCQLEDSYKLHPDFYRTQIMGAFPQRLSIYDAFLKEKHVVNEMCEKIGKPHLFRTSDGRPAGFGILIRPTKKEFRDFALLLDQLLSDDLNPEFFAGDIPTTETWKREDGSMHRRRVGTIMLLRRWLEKHFDPQEPEAIDELFKKLRAVRNARQKPAHKVEDNDFDQVYLKAQRDLINDAFDVARTIRMALENHPNLQGYIVPYKLRMARVWDR